jgi:peptidoglycan/LPS O-acetylase OafA/YrhL/lysophospholipase L1-like esterase
LTRSASSIVHLPALDGLRGLAVFGVLLFHANGFLRGGYLGVDLFFVLSGYLITSILLHEHDKTGKIDLTRFWIRRARRLFPALLSVLFAMGLYATLFAQPNELAVLRHDALATLAYVANWSAILSNKDYWELFQNPSPLEHTWSLAIEEQFYVVWPLLVTFILVVLKKGRRALLVTTLGLALLSILAMLLLYTEESTARVYLGTDTRAVGILLGAVLAASFRPGTTLPSRVVRLLDGVGLFAVLGLGWAWIHLEGDAPFLYRGGFWLTEILCLVMIVLGVVGKASIWARVLSLKPLVLLGTFSYGIYLWHWPINCIITPERFSGSWTVVHALRFTITFIIAFLSYRYFEEPIRRRGIFFGRAVFVVPSAVVACLAVVLLTTRSKVGTAAPLGGGKRPSSLVALAASSGPVPEGAVGIFSVPFTELPRASVLPKGTPRILVLGDSVANKLGWALRYRQDEFGVFIAERGVGNCSIFPESGTILKGKSNQTETTNSCTKNWLSDVESLKPDLTLIVLGGGFFTRARVGDAWRKACETGWDQAYETRLQTLFDIIRPHTNKIALTIVPYPIGRWRTPAVMERVDCFNRSLTRAAQARNVPTIDLMSQVCPTRECNLLSNNAPIRPDGLHFDGAGAEETARYTLRGVRSILGLPANLK